MYSIGDIVEWNVPGEIERGVVVNIDIEKDNAIKVYWYDCNSSCWHAVDNQHILLVGQVDFYERIKERMGIL